MLDDRLKDQKLGALERFEQLFGFSLYAMSPLRYDEVVTAARHDHHHDFLADPAPNSKKRLENAESDTEMM